MPFQTANDYYSFELSVKHNYRHSLEPAARTFLDTLIETSKKRARKLSKASIYWRAQRGCDLTSVKHSDDIMLAFPYDSDRMKPRQRQATEGRVNVRGIPCLYLATTKETAMSETRPWVGSYVSLAKFEIKRTLTIVDLSDDRKIAAAKYGEGAVVAPEKREENVWACVSLAFSIPIEAADESADYVPTQIISEAFRRNGFDGLRYQSLFGTDGQSIALFDPDTASVVGCDLYTTQHLKYSFVKRADYEGTIHIIP